MGIITNSTSKSRDRLKMKKKVYTGPKILYIDIETAPILAYVWGLWDQNVGLNMIKEDWHVLSWAARWKHDPPTKVMYEDQRNAKNINDDKQMLKGIWKLLHEADIVVAQNGKSFDRKKLNARFVLNGFPPPSSYKMLDTLLMARKHFKFTSNKLEYTSDKLNKKYKKLKHNKFPGFKLWEECLKKNVAAFNEIKKYNIHDVLSLEEYHNILEPWDGSINLSIYTDDISKTVCSCGNKHFVKNGFKYTNAGKFQRHRCTKCGNEFRESTNILKKSQRKALLRPTTKV